MARRRRRSWDEQPTAPCEVMLASDGRQDFTKRAVAQAAALAAERGGEVAVVTLAKIYGTRFGLPHPGLLPTKQELAEREGWVGSAIDALKRKGIAADGQVAATRKPARRLADIARARGARIVVIDETPVTGVRRVVEGDVGSELARKLRSSDTDVVVVPRG